ncbi:unnamed protein product [Citrullus colocynthis]|uniref:Uncharacterized protein n=1 Tax=Citrullus colocynthis TaxID=252529 RepID=A0ABP0XUJ5_9ROSI
MEMLEDNESNLGKMQATFYVALAVKGYLLHSEADVQAVIENLGNDYTNRSSIWSGSSGMGLSSIETFTSKDMWNRKWPSGDFT